MMFIDWPILFVDHKSIDEPGPAVYLTAMASMNMAKDMEPGLDLLNYDSQLLAPEMIRRGIGLIRHSKWWAMSNQNVRVQRNHLPIPPYRSIMGNIEGSVFKESLHKSAGRAGIA